MNYFLIYHDDGVSCMACDHLINSAFDQFLSVVDKDATIAVFNGFKRWYKITEDQYLKFINEGINQK